jgi:single-strand selective monofunctional uracil DNA glycosylase
MELVRVVRELARELEGMQFSEPAAVVYNPLLYARQPHEEYLLRFGSGVKEAVFVGMNPGPWGMAQTGVPFGEVRLVRDWLGIGGLVEKPAVEHPKKRVEGFSCRRSEVSGLRFWGLMRERFGQPEDFFRRFFVTNYCPLLFLDGEGRNLTPDKLKQEDRVRLTENCDRALRRTVEALGAARVIGIGAFASKRAAAALEGLPVTVLGIMHPSPQNPQANRDWKGIVLRQLGEQGIDFGS